MDKQFDPYKIGVLTLLSIVGLLPWAFLEEFQAFVNNNRALALLVPFLYGGMMAAFWSWAGTLFKEEK